MIGHPNFTKWGVWGVCVAVCNSLVTGGVADKFELSDGSARLGRTNAPTENPLMRPARAKRKMAIVRDCELKVLVVSGLDTDCILNCRSLLIPLYIYHLPS